MAGTPETSSTALILFSHGSLLCGSGAMLQSHAERLRCTDRYLAVEVGYLNYCTPAIDEAIERAAAAGAHHVIIVPYFLISGKFVSQDLPARLRGAIAAFPGIKFTLTRPLEDAPPLLHAVEELLKTATSPDVWQARAIARAQADCELRPNCPLYGSPLCREADSRDR